jgi:hypothetical protein
MHQGTEEIGRATSPTPKKYIPVKPSKAERRLNALRQALRLPKTLAAIRAIIAEDFSGGALDEHLWAFRGFHEGGGDPHYRARQWRKVRLSAIEPGDVVGVAVWEMAFMVNVAREIEEPIREYSRQNGEGFRLLLPSLARFLGRSSEEAARAESQGLPWCNSPWCAEEQRHAAAFARIVERLTASSPGRENPNRPKTVTSAEADAVSLMISREAAEWNSSSTYTVMAAHADRDLHHLIRNIARDEVKHLAILGAADRYLFGPRPWRRLADVMHESLDEYRTHQRRRSGGELIGTNPITALEVVAAHLLAERSIRRWLNTLPLLTLDLVFDAPSRVPAFEAADLTPERRREIDAALQKGRESRASLSRWTPRRRQRALEQRTFEAGRARAIDEIVRSELAEFRGV